MSKSPKLRARDFMVFFGADMARTPDRTVIQYLEQKQRTMDEIRKTFDLSAYFQCGRRVGKSALFADAYGMGNNRLQRLMEIEK